MVMRAPCLADEIALACTDRANSSTSTSRSLSSSSRKTGSAVSRVVLALLLVAVSSTTVHALFDPGESTQPPDAKVAASQEGKKARLSAIKVSEHKSADTSLALNPVSLHPGCRRTTDLFANVCQSPWSSWSQPRLTSSLVVCPLPEAEPLLKDDGDEERPRERVYAISGTITLPDDAGFEVVTQGPQQKTIGEDGEGAPWPKPGDEGFWRQRGGNLEWVPAAPDPQPPRREPVDPSPSSSPASSPSSSSEAAQAKEYDAWSASIGGEDSELWLRFDQWKDNYLAQQKEREREEHDKQRAAGRKAKDRAKASNSTENATQSSDSTVIETPVPVDDLPSSARIDFNRSADVSHIGSVTVQEQSASSPLPTVTSAEGEKRNDHDMLATAVLGSQHSAAAASAAAAAETGGSIPAMGDAAGELVNLKHRFNFASFDCAAAVHRSNPSAKFASSILSEKKDRYMLSPCPTDSKEGQFVIVELCDEIMVDTLVLANYEFFSRMFKRFRVRVVRSLQGREDEWYDIGTFRARNMRGLQVFKTVNPKADSRFFRYVRIDFLEHYGSEYYCPVSLLRVYGLTQMDDYIREEEEMRQQVEREKMLLAGELEEDEEEENDQLSISPEPMGEEQKTAEKSTKSMTPGDEPESSPSPTAIREESPHSTSPTVATHSASTASSRLSDTISQNEEEMVRSSSFSDGYKTSSSPSAEHPASTSLNHASTPTTGRIDDKADIIQTASVASDSELASSLTVQALNATAIDAPVNTHATNDTIDQPSVAPSASVPSDNSSVAMSSSSYHSPPPVETNGRPSPASGSGSGGGGGSESIYRTITKRLNALETNATLSVQYMEHSRQMLRDVFARMEKRQEDRMAEMLRALNESNWRQIDNLKRRQQVDLQQAIFEFDLHRQQTDAERSALLAQVHILSNEVMLEKRYGMAQLVLLLGLFVFMALTRGSRAAPMLHSSLSRLSGAATPKLRRNRSPANIKDRLGTRQDAANQTSASQFSTARLPDTTSKKVEKAQREADVAKRSRSRSHQHRASSRRDKRVVMAPVSGHQRSSSNGTNRRKSVTDALNKAGPAENVRRTSPLTDKENVKPALPRISIEKAYNATGSRPDYSDMTDEELRAWLRLSSPVSAGTDERFGLLTSPTVSAAALSPKQEERLPLSTGSAIADDSFSSDWGTERSSEGEPDESIGHEAVVSPPLTPVRGSKMSHDAYESDAEEDAPPWQQYSKTKSRNYHHLGHNGGKMRRPTSSGSATGSIRSLESANGGSRTPQRLASPLGR